MDYFLLMVYNISKIKPLKYIRSSEPFTIVERERERVSYYLPDKASNFKLGKNKFINQVPEI